MANVRDGIGPTAIEYAAANITTLRLGRNTQSVVLLRGLPLQIPGLANITVGVSPNLSRKGL